MQIGSMSRVVWKSGSPGEAASHPIEIHYASPSEFMGEFAPGLDSGTVFVATEKPPPSGGTREIIVEIGFISRTFKLMAEISEANTLGQSRLNGKPAGFRLALSDPDSPTRSEMKQLVQQLQKGLAFEAARTTRGAAGEKVPVEKQLRSMPTTLKVMLALKAERDERVALANDPDPQVLQFLLKNSKLGIDEVRTIAARNNLTAQHVMSIAANTAWYSDDQVKLNLAKNPRLPQMMVEQLLGSMTVNQLRIVAGAASTSAMARRVAHRLLYSKGR